MSSHIHTCTYSPFLLWHTVLCCNNAIVIITEENVTERLPSNLNPTPSGFHTSIRLQGHTYPLPGKLWGFFFLRSGRKALSEICSNKLLHPSSHTPTHAVAHSIRHSQTKALWDYRLHKVMMWLAMKMQRCGGIFVVLAMSGWGSKPTEMHQGKSLFLHEDWCHNNKLFPNRKNPNIKSVGCVFLTFSGWRSNFGWVYFLENWGKMFISPNCFWSSWVTEALPVSCVRMKLICKSGSLPVSVDGEKRGGGEEGESVKIAMCYDIIAIDWSSFPNKQSSWGLPWKKTFTFSIKTQPASWYLLFSHLWFVHKALTAQTAGGWDGGLPNTTWESLHLCMPGFSTAGLNNLLPSGPISVFSQLM